MKKARTSGQKSDGTETCNGMGVAGVSDKIASPSGSELPVETESLQASLLEETSTIAQTLEQPNTSTIGPELDADCSSTVSASPSDSQSRITKAQASTAPASLAEASPAQASPAQVSPAPRARVRVTPGQAAGSMSDKATGKTKTALRTRRVNGLDSVAPSSRAAATRDGRRAAPVTAPSKKSRN